VVSGLSPVVANIDGHWRLTWLLTSGPVEISRGMRKLARTPHVNKKNVFITTYNIKDEIINLRDCQVFWYNNCPLFEIEWVKMNPFNIRVYGRDCQRTISTQKLKLLGEVPGYDLYYFITYPLK
jgi:hypothetical protein